MIKAIFYGVVEGFLRNISGPLGRKLRYKYYKNRFASCEGFVRIDEGVIFENPEYIHIGKKVWLDKYSILMAGRVNIPDDKLTKKPKIKPFVKIGELHIGSHSHIGINTIIQAHGGVVIGEYFTSSAGSKIYSLSNDVNKTLKGTISDDAYYIESPIVIGNNVWLGLNSLILGGYIADDVFIEPNSVVVKNVEDNSVVNGKNSEKIRNRF